MYIIFNPFISDAESDKNRYMILEYCQGESLLHYMKNTLVNAFGVQVNEFHNALLRKYIESLTMLL